jgi:DNA-binding GntR family transcriptional regulator
VSVSRTVLREQVKELLLERILSGEFQPGERLVETRIAQELGTSQAPVREALRDLELLRLVESEPFRGARVRAISAEEMAEIYPVRAALEDVAAREACARLDPETDRRLQKELEAMQVAASAGDVRAQVEHDVRFHRLIVEAAGNRTLLEVWLSLRVEARTLMTLLKTGIERRELADAHAPILEALRSGDPERAARVAREHVERFAPLLLKGANAQ